MALKRKGDAEISILYVEDDPEARELVSNVLARKIRSLRLYTAENGEEGLALFRKHRQISSLPTSTCRSWTASGWEPK